jgi:hypothetical protein
MPLAAIAAALTISACGGDSEPVTHGHSEAVYVEAGNLYYQVQISRELNPFAVDDAEYLQGVTDPVASLGREDEWFGVWLRAQNTTDDDHEAASEFKVVDAAGNEYDPVDLGEDNVFAYQPRTVEKKSDNGQPLLPNPDAAAGSGPIQGSLLLFRVPYSIYSNQPVELEIVPPEGGDASTVTLDM